MLTPDETPDEQVLIKAGYDFNQTTRDGATPVFIAAQSGNTDTLRMLVAAGCDVDQANNQGIYNYIQPYIYFRR